MLCLLIQNDEVFTMKLDKCVRKATTKSREKLTCGEGVPKFQLECFVGFGAALVMMKINSLPPAHKIAGMLLPPPDFTYPT